MCIVSVAVFRNILQNILQYMTKDRDTYTYITEIEKKLGECSIQYKCTLISSALHVRFRGFRS
jgi:hypothetical protein